VHRLAGNQGGPPSNARTGYMTSGLARRRSSLRPAQGLRASPGGLTLPDYDKSTGLRAEARKAGKGRLAAKGQNSSRGADMHGMRALSWASARYLRPVQYPSRTAGGRWCVLLHCGPFPLWGATKILFAESACAATDRSAIRESHRRTFGGHQMAGGTRLWWCSRRSTHA
jgi:hypothetical protein